MSGLLGSIFSFGDDLKKRARGLLADPVGHANATVGAFNDRAQSAARGLLAGKGGMESVDALGAGPHALGGLLGAIKVYHGSPHVFNKADSSKIGTGEGAQAYGHGLYWAENPKVAEGYAQMVNMPKVDAANKELRRLAKVMEGDAAYPGAYRQFKSQTGHDAAKQYDAIMEDKLRADPQLYEANLRWPDAAREAKDPLGPQHFLDWDKPLGQQPQIAEKVRPLLGDAVDVLPYSGGWGDLEPNPQAMRELFTKGGTKLGMYSDAEAQALDLYGSAAIKALGKGDKESWKASEALRRAGIPGVMYHDAGSRAAGQGTRNYVTFDDALVELLTRNGLPIK
jgi:hypothetical protein